jgi:hypothetical protein
MAPDVSLTVPVNVAPPTCAKDGEATKAADNTITNN